MADARNQPEDHVEGPPAQMAAIQSARTVNVSGGEFTVAPNIGPSVFGNTVIFYSNAGSSNTFLDQLPVSEASPSAAIPRDHIAQNVGSATNITSSLTGLSTIHDGGHHRDPDYKIYSRQLLCQARGFPLWEPGTFDNFPREYRRRGISIGDVGILDYKTFLYFFNIFLPASDPINAGKVPHNFEPLGYRRIRSKTHSRKMQTLTSDKVERRVNDDSSLSFETHNQEGAVLVMPDGAIIENLVVGNAINTYIAKHASSWYDFIRGMHDEPLHFGELRVVCGVDKVTAWGVAAFAREIPEGRMEFRKLDHGAGPPTYDWHYPGGGGHGRVGPDESEMADLRELTDTTPLRNQCVFVRTLNFNLAGQLFDPEKLGVVRMQTNNDAAPRLDHHSTAVGDARLGATEEFVKQGSADQSHSNVYSHSQLPVMHPSGPINNSLLKMYPDAKIAITEDADWISVISEQDVVFPAPEVLCDRLLASREVCERDGIVTFKVQEGISSEETVDMDLDVVQNNYTAEGLSPRPTSTSAYVEDMDGEDLSMVLEHLGSKVYLQVDTKLDQELRGTEEEDASEPGWTPKQQRHPHLWESQSSPLRPFFMEPILGPNYQVSCRVLKMKALENTVAA